MYVKVTNGVVETYPYSIGQLRKDNRKISFPANPSDELLAEWGVYPVVSTSEPSYDKISQRAIWGTPEFVNGKWTHTWQVVALSAEEQQSVRQVLENDVRGKRDRLLMESDWTQVADAPVDKAAWATYRQALRDLPQAEGFPNVEFPQAPN